MRDAPMAGSSSSLQNRTPSYKWNQNSCWLDSALECLWAIIMRDFDSFDACFSMVSAAETTPIYDLYQRMEQRRTLYLSQDASNYRVSVLSAQRDSFRNVLLQRDLHYNNRKIIDSGRSSESLFVRTVNINIHHS